MDNSLRNEVLRLLALHMDVTSPGGAGIDKAFPGPEKQNISHMTLTEARQAGITMYGDASFSIDAYVGNFPSFAHFVATVIVHETRGVQSLHGVELEQIEPEKGWKTLFGGFAKGVTEKNIFSGRKRLGSPTKACRILATGNEQLYALDCNGSYATLFMQTS
ncbi:hypothetical protein [Myxococcus sp. CA040A]|uniref:hypothetical protein n=1 Tax=Myxococcus sp. CA040A TaxID=2741738 RepID=UPI00157B980F|nr:hypothetical protein [Myxococcus sp. CA040A]NTX08712.1 hypothetical protein [Myxococcus sp. CA040A]